MNYEYIIPPVIALLLSAIVVRFKSILNPSGVILIWIGGWLYISNFSLTGIYPSGALTQNLILTSLISFALGSVIWLNTKVTINNHSIEYPKYYRIIYYISSLLIVFWSINAFYLFGNLGANSYRSAVFGIDGYDSLLFGSKYESYLFKLIVTPIIFIGFLNGLKSLVLNNYPRPLMFSFPIFALMNLMFLGRAQLYASLVLIIYSFVLKINRQNSSVTIIKMIRKKMRRTVFIIVLLSIGGIIAVSLIRTENRVSAIEMFNRYVIGYHTTGFAIFDSDLNNEKSILNAKFTYGRSLLGWIDSVIFIILHQFDSSLMPINGDLGWDLQRNRIIGYNIWGQTIKSNAFSTSFYTLYIDGRWLFIVIIPFLFGRVLSQAYLRNRACPNQYDFTLILILFYSGIFSIFQSPITGNVVWPVILFNLFFRRFSRKRSPLL